MLLLNPKPHGGGFTGAGLLAVVAVETFIFRQPMHRTVLPQALLQADGPPTNVLIDKPGYIRRRFIGARTLPAWEAMIQKVKSGSSPTQAEADVLAK